MYAGSAFVLWDVANNVVEPMNLPEWIPRIVIWVSLIGFPLIAIISWLYNFKGGVPGLSKKISTHSQYKGDDNSSNH